MTYIPSGKVGIPTVELSVATSDNTPVEVWPDTLPATWPTGSTYRALVSAVESTLLANVDYKHFELIGTYIVTHEASELFTNSEVVAAGTGGSSGWDAAFVDANGSPGVRLTGATDTDIEWRVLIETIKTR